MGNHLIISLRSLAKHGQGWEDEPNDRGVAFVDATTGERSRPELDEAPKQSRCDWVSPGDDVWIEHADGTVSNHDANREQNGRSRVFEYGAVSAIAGGAHAICVGSAQGEFAVLAA